MTDVARQPSGLVGRGDSTAWTRRSASLEAITERAISFEQRFETHGAELFRAKARAISMVFDERVIRRAQRVPFPSLCMWVLFGASGWWSGNAVFAELPLFVLELPAAEKLGNQLALMTQLGNAFLITYKILDARFDFDAGKVIHLMMLVALLALLAAAALWDVVIKGQSLPLLGIMVVTGGVGCMSNATYWAFMISYPPVCTKAVGLGMSMGGVLTTVMAATQLSGRAARTPRFSARTFFLMAAALQALWWAVVLVQGRKRPNGAAGAEARRGECQDEALLPTAACASIRQSSGEVNALYAASFLVHAGTYTLPSLLPFVASAYPDSAMEQQMLLWMLVLQQVGESSGRLLVPVRRTSGLLRLAGTCQLLVFSALLASAVWPHALFAAVPYSVARYILPSIVFMFYASYGIMQTIVFLRVRQLVPNPTLAEHAASSMGFLGQMGALSANIAATLVVNCT